MARCASRRATPLAIEPLDEVAAVTGLVIEPLLATKRQIAERLKAHLGVGSETVEGLVAARQAEAGAELLEEIDADAAELAEEAQEASVVRLVNEILLEAIQSSRASDVHIEAEATVGLRIRYRIDGLLIEQPTPAGDQSLPRRDHQPPEDHGAPEHRGETAPAGRADQAPRRGARS